MGDDSAVISFVATARNFCDLLETNTHRSKKRFLKPVLTATVSLYRAGLELPDVKPDAGFNPLGERFEHNKGLPIAERINQNPSQELLPEEATKNLYRQEERLLAQGNPTGTVWADAPARYYAVDVRVNVEILAPSVKHSQEANLGAQMLGVRRDCHQGLGGCAKKDAVDCSRILQCQVGNLLRQCKDDVEVRVHGQQFRFPFREPLSASGSLALRTAPIGTRVVHGDAMPAVVLLHMAAQDRCSAVANILEGFSLLARQHMVPLGQKIVFVYAENIGQFEPMFTHRSGER